MIRRATERLPEVEDECSEGYERDGPEDHRGDGCFFCSSFVVPGGGSDALSEEDCGGAQVDADDVGRGEDCGSSGFGGLT